MKVLVVGSGGREHAICWKLAQSPSVEKIFCAPGNGGIASVAECVPIKAEDVGGLMSFALKEKIGLTVVGPEVSLASGIAGKFRGRGLDIFGPDKQAAQLESSKVYAKRFMFKYGIPTASFEVFEDPDKADAYLRGLGRRCVIKADGLAAGKGVIIPAGLGEALAAVDDIMRRRIFGAAGQKVVIEECLDGREVSILAFTDTQKIVPLASSQDHKRVFDGDKGPNTGGMGAYSPAVFLSFEQEEEINRTVLLPAMEGLRKEGLDYRGVLYAGIMFTAEGPKVLEFNVRFGDPETQAILPRMKSDLAEALLAVSRRKLLEVPDIEWDERACVCVVLVSGGYPGEYSKGMEIKGLQRLVGRGDVTVFHSGTRLAGGRCLSDGGRVLGVSALGRDIKEAAASAYSAAGEIDFEGMHYRRDIAAKFA
ncbi:MAG: phosphoribosylamine--glycine ligase [Candidatus Omnitrophota bacterium]|jgi:phosphoribosylamine--glycine ligase